MRIRIQWIKNLNTLTGKKNFATRERWSKVSDHKLCKKKPLLLSKKTCDVDFCAYGKIGPQEGARKID